MSLRFFQLKDIPKFSEEEEVDDRLDKLGSTRNECGEKTKFSFTFKNHSNARHKNRYILDGSSKVSYTHFFIYIYIYMCVEYTI